MKDPSTNWYQWRNAALMPTNYTMRSLITEHADLLIDQDFPEVLLDFCSHVTVMEVLIADDASPEGFESVLIEHPGQPFVEYVRSTFRQLKAEQNTLLRTRSH